MDNSGDYISREAVVNAINSTPFTMSMFLNKDQCVGARQARDSLALIVKKSIPAADVRPVVRKPVVGYEGLYFITNDGEVSNADGVVMKQHAKMGCGTCYKRVTLCKDGQYKSKYVHRLVAEAFIPNPDNLPVVNHKDEDGTNNKVENLEWCTNQYNANYGTARERQREKIVGVPHTEEHKKKISDSLYQHYDAALEADL